MHPLLGGTSNPGEQPQGSGPSFPRTNTGDSKPIVNIAAGLVPFYCDVHRSGGMNGVIFAR